MDKNEFTPLTNLEHQISALEVAIYNLKQANTPHLNAHTKKMLTSITENLINTKNEIRKSVNQLSDEHQTYIQKMLQNNQSLNEDNNVESNTELAIAKQNLELLDEFETLIVSSPNCNDTIILAIKNGKLIMRNFCNEYATEETLNKHTEGLSLIHRDIEFTDKIYILASDGLDKPMLFSIEETANGLKIKSVERKLKQNLLNR